MNPVLNTLVQATHLRTILLIAALAALFIGSQLLGGLTTDEKFEIDHVPPKLEFMQPMLSGDTQLDFTRLPRYSEHYGIVPIWPVYGVASLVSPYFDSFELLISFIWHLFTFVLGMLTCYLVYKTVEFVADDRYVGIAAAVLLFLTPSWLGHSFFNYKDMPTAFAVMLAFYLLCEPSAGARATTR